jgi:hypothetical protein
MATNQATTPDGSNSRARTITSCLLIMLAIMIVMDIFARRRGAATQPLPDVKQRYQ